MYVTFVVGKNGKVRDVRIINGLSEIINEKIIKVMVEMPEWEPATNDGKPVSFLLKQPIRIE